MKKITLLVLCLLAFVACQPKTEKKDIVQLDEPVVKEKEEIKENIQPKKLIVIDAGHQQKGNRQLEPIGPNATQKKAKVASGTHGKWSKLNEYELTLQVSLRLKEALLKNNYEVIMIRETANVNISNSERAEIANENHADAFIRIHANGSENANDHGAMTICQTSQNKFNKEFYQVSKNLSSAILKECVSSTGAKNNGVWETDTMSGINWCQTPVTILEMGYMTNKEEDLKLASVDYQKKVVDGIVKGLDKFFDIESN